MKNREKELKAFQKALFTFALKNGWNIKSLNFFIGIDSDCWSVFGSCFTKEETQTQDFFIRYENKKLIFT